MAAGTAAAAGIEAAGTVGADIAGDTAAAVAADNVVVVAAVVESVVVAVDVHADAPRFSAATVAFGASSVAPPAPCSTDRSGPAVLPDPAVLLPAAADTGS